MIPNSTNTVSLLANTFFCDTLPAESPESPLEGSSSQIPINRELLDMPNVIPENEDGDECFHWDDVSG